MGSMRRATPDRPRAGRNICTAAVVARVLTTPHASLRRSALAMACGLAMAGGPAWAQTEPADAASPSADAGLRYDIPAGPLEPALQQFSARSGVVLTYDPALTAGRATQGLSGEHAVAAGLSQLLRGTGLHPVARAANAFALQAQATSAGSVPATQDGAIATLTTVTVSAQADSGAGTEGSGNYAARRATVGKMAIPLKEIPQSVTVVTRQQLDDQNVSRLEDAMKGVTGATVVRYDAAGLYSTFNARGFGSDTYQLDGVTLQTDANGIYLDLAAFDRVEVLRGAAGMFSGAGEPGVTINLARKRALATFQAETALQLGSWNYRRADLDVTGALIESGRVRGRLVSAWQDNDTFMNNVDGGKKLVYGTVEADVTENTLLSVGVIWQDVSSVLSRGLPTWADGRLIDLPRSAMPVMSWNRQSLKTTDYFAELEHRLPGAALIKATMRRTERTNKARFTDPSPPDADGWMTDLTSSGFNRKDTDTTGDLYYNTPLHLGGRTHNLLLGADWRENHALTHYAPYPGEPTGRVNLFDPDPNAIPDPDLDYNANLGDTMIRAQGVYSQLRIKPTDALTLVAGGRLSWWRSAGVSWGTTSDFKTTRKFTPYGAVIYALNPRLSVYGSYSEIFKPQNDRTVDGDQIAPRTGSQIELGLKGDSADGQLQYSTGIFQITDRNRAVADPLNEDFSIARGKVRSQGYEAEIRGRLSPSWQLTAGYAYTTTKYLTDTPEQQGKVFDTFTPRHNANLWARYAVPASILPGLELGFGLRAMSSFYSKSGNITITGKGHSIASLMASYRINSNLRVALNVDNLFDKVYWEKVSGTSRQNFYGAPRSITLALRGSFQ